MRVRLSCAQRKKPKKLSPVGAGGVGQFFFYPKSYFFVTRNSVQNFKIVAQLLLGYFWLVIKKMMELLILIATLATTEVSVGALAKADQNSK